MKIKNNLYYNIPNDKFEIYICKSTQNYILILKTISLLLQFNYNSFCLSSLLSNFILNR